MDIVELFAAAAEHAGVGPGDEGTDAALDASQADAAARGAEEQEGAGQEGADKGAPDGKDSPKPTEEEIRAAGTAAMKEAMLEEAPGAEKGKTAALDRAIEKEGGIQKEPPAKGGEPAEKDKKADSEKLGPDGKPLKSDEKTKADKPEPTVEEEIAALKLGEKGAARFRELTGTLKERDASLEAVNKLFNVNGQTAEQLIPQIKSVLSDANTGRGFMQAIDDSGMGPEEFGTLMTVATHRNSGDPDKMRTAFDAITVYRDELAAELGIATDTVDPLVTHAALLTAEEKERLATGDLGKGDARELLTLRAAAKKRAETNDQIRTRTEQQGSARAAIADASTAVVEFTEGLRATDPETFDKTFKFLTPKINRIQNTTPPSKWLELIKAEFTENMPLFKVAPVKKDPVEEAPIRTGRVPGRANGRAGAQTDQRQMQQEITEPLQGLKSGMAAALEEERRAAGKTKGLTSD